MKKSLLLGLALLLPTNSYSKDRDLFTALTILSVSFCVFLTAGSYYCSQEVIEKEYTKQEQEKTKQLKITEKTEEIKLQIIKEQNNLTPEKLKEIEKTKRKKIEEQAKTDQLRITTSKEMEVLWFQFLKGHRA